MTPNANANDPYELRCRDYLLRLLASQLGIDLSWPMPQREVVELALAVGYSPDLPTLARHIEAADAPVSFTAAAVVDFLAGLCDEQHTATE